MNNNTLQLTSAALVAVASFSTVANAADEVVTMDTVTVSETKEAAAVNPNADPDAPYKIDKSGNEKFTQPLIDVSKTINVIGKEQMADNNVTALKELMRTQPGITLGTGEGGNAYGDRFIIRGFEARGDVFMDGMRDPGSSNREVFNTEQVEIAKGASSTFAGRGTSGGAVNSVSKKPQEDNFAKISATAGEYDKRITFDGNRVINDKLTVRANVMLQDSDVAGRDGVTDERQGFAIGAAYKATDKTELLFDYYHLRTDGVSDFGIPWDSDAGKPADVGSNWYGISGRDFQETGADIFTATMTTDFTNQTRLTNKIRIGETTNDYVAVAPSINGDGLVSVTNPKTAAYTNKFVGLNSQLTHERHIGNQEHTFAVGFEASKEEVEKLGYDIVGITDECVGLDVYNPDNNQSGCGTAVPNDSGSLAEVSTLALYAMDTIKFSDKWQVSGGLRYDYYDIERNSDINEYDDANVAKLDTDFLNGHLGFTYKPRENGSIYLSGSSSSTVPGELLDAGAAAYGGLTDLSAEYTKPERNKTIELGTKWNVANDNLTLAAAIFQTDKTNQLEASGRGDSAVVTQTGEARVKGVEFSVSGNATPKLTLSAGAAYLDTEVTDSSDETTIGAELANVASKSAFVQAKYSVTPRFAVGGTVTHTGEIHGGTFAATSGNTLEASNRLDLMANYKVNESLSFQANILNATDEPIYDALYRSGSPFVYVGTGRAASLTMNYEF